MSGKWFPIYGKGDRDRWDHCLFHSVFLGIREFNTFDEGSYEIDMKLPNFIIIYSCNNNFIMV